MNDENIKEKMLSIGAVSEYLGVSIDTLRRWEKKGKVKAYRSPGGHRYFKKNDVDKLFGTKYERAQETTPREATKEQEPIEKNGQDAIPKLQVVDRQPHPVNVPTPEPVQVITQERWQTFEMQTQNSQPVFNNPPPPIAPPPPSTPPPTQSILTPATQNVEEPQRNSIQQQNTQPANKSKNNIKMALIIGGTAVVLVIALVIIFRFLFPAQVISPVPY